MITATDLRPLKKWLQRGEMSEICEEVGIGRAQGANIMKGKCKNWLFVHVFLQRVEANKALFEKVNSI